MHRTSRRSSSPAAATTRSGWSTRRGAASSSSRRRPTMRHGLAERPVDASAEGPAWHTEPVDRVAATLGTSLADGLAPEEAARRLAEHGPNEIESEGGTPAWQLLLAQFRNVLI